MAVSATQATWADPCPDGVVLRRKARTAYRAVAPDPTDSEALAWKSCVIDPVELAMCGTPIGSP